MKVKNLVCLCLAICVFCSLVGCDSFVRKFTRKSKKENTPQEEMVLVPIEYKAAPTTSEEVYRKYLLYWKSWQDELIESLLANANHKKQVDSASEAIKNLEELKKLLKEGSRPKLEAYIQHLNAIKSSIESDTYGSRAASLRSDAERVKRDILRDFSYQKAKNNLI
jgi:hypothetical protein